MASLRIILRTVIRTALLVPGLFTGWCLAQTPLSPTFPTDAKIELVSVSRDSFPLVSVSFTVKSATQPFLTLSEDKVMIMDDAKACPLLSFERTIPNKALNLALVIDHSGSMEAGGKDNLYMRQHVDSVFREMGMDKDTTGKYQELYAIINKVLPPENSKNFLLEAAKPGLISFIHSLDKNNDSIGVVGFSDAADVVLPVTNDYRFAVSVINSMHAKGGSAVLEGIQSGISQVKYSGGTRAVIVLTDGVETSSPLKMENLVKKANDEQIRIYIIGVGEAASGKLTEIAKGTGAEYFYVNSLTGLESALAEISSKIREKPLYKIRANCGKSEKPKGGKISVAPLTGPGKPAGFNDENAKGSESELKEPGDPK